MAAETTKWNGEQQSAISTALAQIAASTPFATAERLQKLLGYLVEETLAGRAHRISQFSIAMDVLGRDQHFDPTTDSVVRVEAGRLRTKLQEYYSSAGTDDQVRITLPRGKYIPEISFPVSATVEPTREFSTDNGTEREVSQSSVAVLPFINMSGELEQEYFSDGMSEEILNALNAVEDLHVAARTSAFSFKNKNVTVREIGNTLNVNYVIEGSVRRAGDRLRISAQLIGVEDGYKVWSESYDRRLTDVFAVQEDIAGAVANALEVKLGVKAETAPLVRARANIDAYDAFLRGRHLMRSWHLDSFDEAVKALEEAIDADPDYGEAYGHLAYTLAMSSIYRRHYDVAPKCEQYIKRALELSTDQPEALAAQAYLTRPDWQENYQVFKRALQKGANDALLIMHYTRAFLAVICQFQKAIQILDAAKAKDPMSSMLEHARARVLFHSGDLHAAAEVCDRLLEQQSDVYPANYLAAEINARLGNIETTEKYISQIFEITGSNDPFALYVRGLLEIARNQETLAQKTCDLMIQNWATTEGPYTPPYLIGQLFIELNDIDTGLHWFQTAWYEKDFFLVDFRAHYVNNPAVWNHPLGQRIARLMKLDDDSLAKMSLL